MVDHGQKAIDALLSSNDEVLIDGEDPQGTGHNIRHVITTKFRFYWFNTIGDYSKSFDGQRPHYGVSILALIWNPPNPYRTAIDYRYR